LHLYRLFKDFCNSAPKYRNFKSDKKKIFFSPKYIFHTYSLPCYLYYYNLFNINRVKRIPLNNGELLTPKGLAYWSMDDGSKQSSGFFFGFK
jgi:hypothetical protein